VAKSREFLERPRDVVEHHELQRRACAIAVFEQFLKFGTVYRLCGFPGVCEQASKRRTPPLAVGATGLSCVGRLRFCVCSSSKRGQ